MSEWSSFARPLSISHQISLPLLTGEGMQAYVIGRPDRDYAESQTQLAAAVAPALSAVLRQHGVLAAIPSGQRDCAREVNLTGRQLAVLELLTRGLTAQSPCEAEPWA
jgi:DNA-binding NarL/FixJ family response regulator